MQDEQEAIDLVYVFFYLTFGPWHAPGHATWCQGLVIDTRDLCQTGLVPSVVVTVTGTVTQWFCDFTDFLPEFQCVARVTILGLVIIILYTELIDTNE